MSECMFHVVLGPPSCAGGGAEAQEVRACLSACGLRQPQAPSGLIPIGHWGGVCLPIALGAGVVREGLLEVVGHRMPLRDGDSGREEREVGSGLGWSLARVLGASAPGGGGHPGMSPRLQHRAGSERSRGL